MFLEKNVVHPTVEFLKKEYAVTWEGMGKILSDRMKTLGQKINLSPANVRNFSTSRSSAWWFWPQISDLVLNFWNEERSKASTPQELMNVDLKFSGLFSEDLKNVYSLWHMMLTVDEERRKECVILRTSVALTNSTLSSHEAFFGCEFPRIDAVEEYVRTYLLAPEE